VTAMADSLQAAIQAAESARQSAIEATRRQHAVQAALEALLKQEAAYVQNAATGDAVLIESSGFAVRNGASPVGKLPAPVGVRIDGNLNPGSLGVRWRLVPGAKSYVVQWALDSEAEDDFLAGEPSTSTKALATGLRSGSRYFIRVAAVNSAGKGLWSAPLSKIAP